MKRLHLFCFFAVVAFQLTQDIAWAQVQQGVVRTIGRPGRRGQALQGVVIRVRGSANAVLTGQQGTFSITLPDKHDGDALVIQSVQKQGYELRDSQLTGRQLVFSSQVPLEILMVDSRQLEADRRRIEEKSYEVAERNYRKKLEELQQQRDQNSITAERYRLQLQELENNYERYLSLIGELADRYARTDYDQLDSIDREINSCIENGELDRADSLIHSVFDPETVLERNRNAKEEIRQRMEFAQSILDKAQKDRQAIQRDQQYAARVSALADRLAEEYLAQGDKERARETLARSLEIKEILHGADSPEVQRVRQRIGELGH